MFLDDSVYILIPMTRKPVTFSPYGAKRWVRRCSLHRVGIHRKRPYVSAPDVKNMILTGTWQDAKQKPGAQHRFMVERFIKRGDLLRVVFLAFSDHYRVIDVQWHGDPPGEPHN